MIPHEYQISVLQNLTPQAKDIVIKTVLFFGYMFTCEIARYSATKVCETTF